MSIQSFQRSVPVLATAALLAFATSTAAQEPRPTEPAEPSEPAPRTEAARDVLDLIEQLGAEGFRERRAAENELRAMGDKAKDALRSAADEHEDPEVRWRARRLIREVEGERGELTERDGAQDRSELGPDESVEGIERRMDSLMRRLERALGGAPVPQGRPDAHEMLRDLRQQMEELQRDFDSMGRGRGLGFGPVGGGLFEGMAQRVEIGPDGVRVETRQRGESGEEETKVYEAPDVESFREKYPEIADRFGIGADGPFGLRPGRGGLQFRFGPGARTLTPWQGLRPGLDDQAPQRDWPQPLDQGPGKGQRLGVYVGELAPAVRDYLELEEGVGLMVDEVADEGLARSMGIRPKDIVLDINGDAIGSPSDVARVLGGIKKGEAVKVTVLRKGQRLELSAEKEFDAESGKLKPRRQVR
jgi:hypothetical protein